MLKGKLREVIEKTIKQPEVTYNCHNSAGDTYCYPHKERSIYNKLIGENDVSKTKDYFVKTETGFFAEYKYLKKLFVNLEFNPYSSKPYEPSCYYEKSNIFSDINVLFDYKHNPITRQNILVVGERGCGKTALINNWLNQHHKQLDQENIFWVRCDGEKLYNFWIRDVDFLKEPLDLDTTHLNNLANLHMKQGNYEKAELLYKRLLGITEKFFGKEHTSVGKLLNKLANVYLRQGKHNEAEPIALRALGITEKYFDKNHSTYGKFINLQEYFDLRFVYIFSKFHSSKNDFFKRILSLMERISPTYQYPVGRHEINKTTTRRIIDGIRDLKETIDQYEKEGDKDFDYSYIVMRTSIASVGREKRRWLNLSKALQRFFTDNDIWLFKIADGVDNIKVGEESSRLYYNHMLNEIYRFNYYRPNQKQIHLMALRGTTYSDACKGPQVSKDNIDILPLKSNQLPLKKIWDLRLEFIRPDLKSNSIFMICAEMIKRMSVNSELPYNYSVRDFLHNKLSLILLVYYRYKQLGSNPSLQKIGDIAESFENRNLFLNGRLYLNTYEESGIVKNENGICYVNLFYFNLDTYNEQEQGLHWQGLCGTRILQILIHHKIFAKTKLKQYLFRVFGYDKKIINDTIKQLSYYRMIDTSCCSKYINLTITKKGEQFLNSVYTDVIFLYYFALDTPLPRKLIDKKLIVAHENKLNKTTDFPYTVVCTAITFISFLISINEIEKKKLSSSMTKKNQTISMPKEIFTLPFLDKVNFDMLWRSITRQIDSANNKDTESIYNYLDELTRLGI